MVGDNTPWPVFGTTRSPVTGPLNIELLSPFGDATRATPDARALAAMMRHIKAVMDSSTPFIMIQVENETGFQGDTRDRSPLANKAFEDRSEGSDGLPSTAQRYPDSGVAQGVGGHRFQNLRDVGRGVRQSQAADEIFMAWNFARYINRVVEAGKAEYPIPMFTNCPQLGFGTAPAPLREADRAVAPMPTR